MPSEGLGGRQPCKLPQKPHGTAAAALNPPEKPPTEHSWQRGDQRGDLGTGVSCLGVTPHQGEGEEAPGRTGAGPTLKADGCVMETHSEGTTVQTRLIQEKTKQGLDGN